MVSLSNHEPSRQISMKYALMLVMLGLAQVIFAYDAGIFSWLFLWSGLSWIFAGGAYGFVGARAFGKRNDGSMVWWNVLLFFPYLAATWLLWYTQKSLTKEPLCNQVSPGVWLGRRCSASELPSGVGMVVDLTAEFAEMRQVREGRAYVCLPILDASIPSLTSFQELVQIVASVDKPIYVHCALGHGRSATVVVALLVARGDALSVDQAELIVKMVRPGIAINRVQRHFLQQWQINL
jgi:protein-tyrosine phosphatase